MTEQIVFQQLKEVISSLGEGLVVKKDQPDYYYLNTNKLEKNKEIFFGAVQIRKSYVAYHLFPVYKFPALLNDLPPEIKKRMQGKSCFNFKKELSEEDLVEMRRISQSSYDAFVKGGMIKQ